MTVMDLISEAFRAPTFSAACQHEACDRQVGDYFNQAEARGALRTHDEWRHENFQLSDGVS